ncbi:MAG: hypothetical protein GY842_24495 [bacterium]|nr:hypothetical protein [bacterium]
MIGTLNIGSRRIVVAAYNPRDALALLYCRYVVERSAELLGDVPTADVHAWLREHVPDCAELLDTIEGGAELPSSIRDLKELPVTPGEERFELPIIAWLRMEARNQHGIR